MEVAGLFKAESFELDEFGSPEQSHRNCPISSATVDPETRWADGVERVTRVTDQRDGPCRFHYR